MNLHIIGIQLIGRIDFEEEIKASVCLGRPCSRTPPPVFASARYAGPDFRGISSSPESSSRSVTLVEVAPLSELRLSYLVTWKLWVACKLVFGLRDVFERLSVRRVASSLGLRKQVGVGCFNSAFVSFLFTFTSLSPTLPRTYFVFPSPDRILRITRANTSPRSRIANSVGFGHKVFTHRLA